MLSTCHIYWAALASCTKVIYHCTAASPSTICFGQQLGVLWSMKQSHIPLQPVKISPHSDSVVTSLNAFSSLFNQLFIALHVEISFWHTSASQSLCNPFLKLKLFYGYLLNFKPYFRFSLQTFLLSEMQPVKPLTRACSWHQEMQMPWLLPPSKQSDSSWTIKPEVTAKPYWALR